MKQFYAFLAVITLFVLINVSFSSSYSDKPLSIVQSTQTNEVETHLAHDVVNDSLNALMIQAIWDKDQTTLRRVLKQGSDVNWVNKADGYAPIHWAVERGFGNILGILISNGADVNAMTNGAIGKDRSALHIAAGNRQPSHRAIIA